MISCFHSVCLASFVATSLSYEVSTLGIDAVATVRFRLEGSDRCTKDTCLEDLPCLGIEHPYMKQSYTGKTLWNTGWSKRQCCSLMPHNDPYYWYANPLLDVQSFSRWYHACCTCPTVSCSSLLVYKDNALRESGNKALTWVELICFGMLG